MKHPLRCRSAARQYGFLGLLALVASASAVRAQSTPSTIYALGNVTQTATVAGNTYDAGTQTLSLVSPSNFMIATLPLKVVGISGSQSLVGLDVRPTTGVLYALGYDASIAYPAANAQLYTLTITTASTTTAGTATLTAIGGAISLNLQDTNTANTRGLTTNVGFDFNPRVDRIRVVAPNGTNYRLNPNTGVVATDGTLAYAASGAVPAPAASPYVGTGAYTNSRLGVSGTTLYDIDLTATKGVLSTQAPPNVGQLNTVANVTFAVNGSGTYTALASPTIRLDVDIFYNSSAGTNVAYLLESRYSDLANTSPTNGTTSANRFSSNLYTLDLTTGQATGSNVFGQSPIFLSNIAAAITTPLTWNGSISNAWNDATNWTPNQVPTSSDNVFIPGPSSTVKFQPIVNDGESVNSITLGAGSVLTTANGGMLSVYGNFVNNDGTVAGSGSGTVALVGTAQQEIAGAASSNFRNLSVGSAGAFTSAPVSVERGLTVTGNLAIGSGQSFTLLSNSTTGTAYVVNNGGTVSGTATVQRYIDGSLNGGTGYRLYSAPVTNTTLGDLATSTYSPVFNPAVNSSPNPGAVTPFPTVYGYSQSQYENSPAVTINTDFERGYYSPESTTAWVSGTGYSVNIPSSEIVDFVGTLANGAIGTTAQGRSSKANAGWQLLGNPYPSAIDWDKVSNGGLSGLNSAVFIFKSSGQYTGSYTAYVNGQSNNSGTNVIPLGQGFFVRTSAVGGSGSINFANSQRFTTDPGTAIQRTTADARPQLLLELGNGTVATQTDVYFESGATTAFDGAFDAEALPTTNGLLLASEAGASLLAINGLPALAGTVTVPLRVAAPTAGTYTLRVANLANLPAGYHAYLRDASQNTYTDLATTPSLSVSLAAGTTLGRFAVVFGTNATLATAPAALAALVAVYPNPAHGTAVLLLPTALRGQAASQVEVVNALGQSVLRRTVAAGGSDQVELPLSSLASGLYTVRATTASGSVAKQLVVE